MSPFVCTILIILSCLPLLTALVMSTVTHNICFLFFLLSLIVLVTSIACIVFFCLLVPNCLLSYFPFPPYILLFYYLLICNIPIPLPLVLLYLLISFPPLVLMPIVYTSAHFPGAIVANSFISSIPMRQLWRILEPTTLLYLHSFGYLPFFSIYS